MKLLLPLLFAALFALAAEAPKPTPTPAPAVAPLVDPAIQIEVLATQYELVVAQSAATASAARYDKDVAAKQAEAGPPMDKAAKACGAAFQPAARDHKVICVAVPGAPPTGTAVAPKPATPPIPKK